VIEVELERVGGFWIAGRADPAPVVLALNWR
jgi:hypothetical protein